MTVSGLGGSPGVGSGRLKRSGRDVVRGVRVEERGEVLDVAASDAELELTAPVRADALLLAVVVGREQPLDDPKRDGFTFTVFGGQGSASMSSTEWMIASHVTAARPPRGSAVVSSSIAGSSSHAPGNPSITRR